MTEKRFELNVNQHNQCDIIDLVESKEKNAICIYNDLGNYHFSSAKALCELLNELHEENRELKSILKEITYRTDADFSYLIPICSVSVKVSPKMYKHLNELIRTKMW